MQRTYKINEHDQGKKKEKEKSWQGTTSLR